MKRVYSSGEKMAHFSVLSKPIDVSLEAVLQSIPWSIPSLRPKPHPIISYNVTRFVLDREFALEDEYFINDDFRSLLHFQKSPAKVIYHITHPYLHYLWKDGGKELINHFFPNDGIWRINALLDDTSDSDQLKAIQFILNVEEIKQKKDAENYGQKMGFIHFFFVAAPIFKAFRKAFYGMLKLETEVKVRSEELVWIQYKNDTFICSIWDKRKNLDPNFHIYVRKLIANLNNNLKQITEGKLPQSAMKLKKLTTVFEHVAPYLKFSYKETPPRFVSERFERKEIKVIPSGYFFTFRFLRFKYTTEVELLSMAKTVFGITVYMEYAHRFYKELLKVSCKQAVNEIAAQAMLYEHPTILDQQENSLKTLFCVPY